MRAIIIEDKDCQALVDQLRLEFMLEDSKILDRENKDMLQDVHRAFHYTVVRWLQAQGWKR